MAPALLPEVAGESAMLEELRSTVDSAVLAVGADIPIVVIAPGVPGRFPPGHGGDLRRFGRPEVAVSGVPADLPWPAVLGRLLLARHQLPAAEALLVDGSAAANLPSLPIRLVVLGDGSACRSTASPGGWLPDAVTTDAGFAAALGSGDPLALADLTADPDLQAAGVPVWRAVGRALAGVGLSWTASPVVVADPLGVGSFVTVWTAG
jgi:hypothetical protein